MSVSTHDKHKYVETWGHSHHFSPRQREYLALSALKFHGAKGLQVGQEYQEFAHRQLDDIWSSLNSFSPEEKVILMTLPSSHPDVLSILGKE